MTRALIEPVGSGTLAGQATDREDTMNLHPEVATTLLAERARELSRRAQQHRLLRWRW